MKFLKVNDTLRNPHDMYYRYPSPKFEKKLGVRVHLVQPWAEKQSSKCSKFGYPKVREFEVQTFWVLSKSIEM